MTLSIKEVLESTSPPLRERVRVLSEATACGLGEFVLYWLQTAVRSDENPALDFAIQAANRLQLPVLVCQAVYEDQPYAADRHHLFLLEGARDLQATIGQRNVAYALHLERPGHRGPHLQTLANRAAVVITEDMPTAPRQIRNLGRDVSAPVIAVDTACVVPMQLVGQAYERAFAYRQATKTLYAERLTQTFPPVIAEHAFPVPCDLPFTPVDLQNTPLHHLVAQCEIDHTIGPVPHTPGGTKAGYRRWQDFKQHKLSRYAKTRNNPQTDGVSRLSPYLHHGMVSPQRIAREAAEIGSAGAEKFLDELLIWRELAYAFCFYRPDHAEVTALPAWAVATLADHESDARPARLAWEQLARGDTGDPLWDAAQKSLLIHGELHNNVRMTWGKALLNWTPNAEQALAMMIDLNHRYALDGQDPASYGGILWCLGQFDRPFPPARPIFGTVRDRSTTQHSRRLDSDAYLRHTTRPLVAGEPTIAVIGAGISGLICARTLQDHGLSVTVFDKSRGPGGRMATRRSADGVQFDHGAQYFTVRDPRFRRYVDSWQHDGLVAPWQGRIVVVADGQVQAEKHDTRRYVGVPAMNTICRHVATDLNLQIQTELAPPQRVGDHWQLTDEQEHDLGSYDIVLVTAPAPQSAALLQAAPQLAKQAASATMSGCWAVMLTSAQPLDVPYAAAFVHQSPLAWIANNSSKVGRSPAPETWVLHASEEWSKTHLKRPATEVAQELLAEFWRAIGSEPQPIQHCTAHLWRFALPTAPWENRCLFDDALQMGACGDWCGGPRVEGAFLSGAAAAGRGPGRFREGAARPRCPKRCPSCPGPAAGCT